MDTSRQDREQQVLQKAASFLNLPVEELLRLPRGVQRSPPSDSTSTLGGRSDSPHYDRHGDANYQQRDANQLAMGKFPSFPTPWPIFVSHSSSEGASHASGTVPQEDVTLLNPEIGYAWYACNKDYHMIDFGEISGSDSTNSLGTDGFIQLTPYSQGTDADSESTARDDGADMSSADERAPRPGTVKSLSDGSVPGLSGRSIRKKRARYTASNRIDTRITRSLNACVRCRIQRNRCIPDPHNPRGPCQSCQIQKARLSRLPCLRYKLSDSTLFRTGLDYMPFYNIEKQWISGSARVLCLSQDRGSFLRVELKQFVPPHDPTTLDLKGRSMYAVNWAIADPDAVTEALNDFVDGSLGCYLESILDGMDDLVWDVFHAAIRSSVFPQPNLLLRKTLRLWVVCRFIESRWRCSTDQEDEDITINFPDDPFYDWVSLPPYVDYQFASIIINRVLLPLREEILRELERMVEKHKPEDWYVTFLAFFILLQNYELQMQFQRDFAKRRQAPVRYLDMPLVRATNSGAKTILAHFHYCCKGNQPFGQTFDWESTKIRRMARLDAEQSRFMASYRDRVIAKGEEYHRINHTHEYDNMYWYTSQLFDPDWKPRDTLEHAPPSTSSLRI